MIGQVISHYKILEKLGEGGMGVVYKAEDTKLQRIVALKLLPPAVTNEASERERFNQEARAASQLLHPNVTAIFEINEANGQVYLAMEYVDGATLKKVIREKEPLPVKDALDIGIQVCSGLSAAHEKGIVHRDIKSENILLNSKGEVKITDFGLAKLKGVTKLTKTGSTLGTAAYMSPEQARGEEVDARSDIFSCGVVLYELLTSKLPFRGEHHAAIFYSLVNEEPFPIARFNENISPEVQRIVSKALSKNKDDRYQHTDEMLADLKRERKSMEYIRTGSAISSGMSSSQHTSRRWLSSATMMVFGGIICILALVLYLFRGNIIGKGTEKSSQMIKIAVLPFENQGPADQEYFADGLTDEVSTKLSGLSGLAVIAPSSSMHYKRSTKSVQEIGNELGVGYLLQGTIRWETGDSSNRKNVHLRVNPRLIKIADGTQMWSQSLEGTMAGVFKIQSDIAQQVAAALDVTLLQPERESVNSKPTDNTEAYDYYLRGNEYMSRGFSGENLENGLAMYQKAIDADPNFALAYARLGRYQTVMYFLGFDHSKERLQRAKDAINKAFALRPNLAEAYIANGYYYKNSTWDLDHAVEQFTFAKKIQPNNADLLHGLGICLFYKGKYEEGLSTLEHAVEVDPRSADFLNTTALMCTSMRKYDESNKYSDRLISFFPDYETGYYNKIAMYLQWEGKTENARKVLDAMPKKFDSVDRVYMAANLDILDRKYDTALHRIMTEGREDTSDYYTTAASIAYLQKQTALQHRLADSARIWMENRGTSQLFSDDSYHYQLSRVFALLGKKERAMREFDQGKLIGIINGDLISTLAEIHLMVDEPDSAVMLISDALSHPGNVSVALLRLDPTWDALRDNPRFQQLIAEDK